jgi:hypothetical protein
MTKSVDEQIRAMRSRWPGFKVIEQDDHSVRWEGVLVPDKREHLVRVRYRVPMLLENVSLQDCQPRVQVIKPVLERHPDYELGPIPHVYVSKLTPMLPYLCLFSPEKREWDPSDLIAETTIFWTSEWLYFYEGWLVTKKWRGGGHHPMLVNGSEKKLEAV